MASSKLPVYDWNKKEVGSVDLPAKFLETPLRKDLLQEVVKWQQACKRSGTHSTLSKGEVRGGGKKPFKQKGTGEARQGSTRSPLNPGGGVIFGPKPRDYSYSLPKKVKKAGLKTALAYLANEGRLFVVKDMTSKDGKTKELSERLKKFGVEKSVLVDAAKDQLFGRAAKNLKKFTYVPAAGVNVFDLLKYDCAILTQSSFEKVIERVGV